MLKVFNDTARFINQVVDATVQLLFICNRGIQHYGLLDLRKNHGDEEMRARDLFYGLWIPDLFMEKVENNEDWCLFCPNKCKGLSDTYGEPFRVLYEEYESKNMYSDKVPARELWYAILDSQMETGTPYLLYKDSCNKKSNQQNLGTIKSSNLCCEIVEYSDNSETAVCNLASIALPAFVNKETNTFDYDHLHYVTQVVTENLNMLIVTFILPARRKQAIIIIDPLVLVYKARDLFVMMNIPFHSEEAKPSTN